MNGVMLKSVMVLNGDTIRDLAEYLHISPQSTSDKINERGTEFKLGEIQMIKEKYRLSPDQVDAIFFNG